MALCVLVVCSAAAAHGGGGALGFRSTVTRVEPTLPGVSVTVLDSDDRLRLRNDSGKSVIVLGYEGEPYLAFRSGRVERNVRSPATYLNDDRFGKVAVPARADADARPEWEQVSAQDTFEWHDHRIHWMSTTLPPRIESAKDEPHHVFDWTVLGTVEGEPLSIVGSLDYEPPPSGNSTILVVLLIIVSVGGVALVWFRRSRGGR